MRYRDTGETVRSVSIPVQNDPILIVCPRCTQMAEVRSALSADSDDIKAVACTACGFSKQEQICSRRYNGDMDNPVDVYFGYELWLKTDCAGHTLWAYNIRHLDFLEGFVAADLRERAYDVDGWHARNGTLVSRLPLWIKSAKNRDEVLKAVARLRNKLC